MKKEEDQEEEKEEDILREYEEDLELKPKQVKKTHSKTEVEDDREILDPRTVLSRKQNLRK
jgi:hypothetical protein